MLCGVNYLLVICLVYYFFLRNLINIENFSSSSSLFSLQLKTEDSFKQQNTRGITHWLRNIPFFSNDAHWFFFIVFGYVDCIDHFCSCGLTRDDTLMRKTEKFVRVRVVTKVNMVAAILRM